MDRQNMIFIGVIESNKNRRTINIIKEVLMEFHYRLLFINDLGNIICLKNNENILTIVDSEPENIEAYRVLGIKFDIVVHNFINKEEYKNDLLNPQFSHCKYYILNSDDSNWNLLPLNLLDALVVNYGYNRKSSLTISSYRIEGKIKANLYLQRSIKTISGDYIEPFEFKIEKNSQNKEDIYSILAATALNLILFNENLSSKLYKVIKI